MLRLIPHNVHDWNVCVDAFSRYSTRCLQKPTPETRVEKADDGRARSAGSSGSDSGERQVSVSHTHMCLAGLWNQSPSNFGLLEPEPKIFRWWSRSLNLDFRSTNSLLGKRVVQIIQWFLVFHGPNRSGAGAKNF